MEKDFNARCFEGNRWRAYIHYNRFYWLARHLKKLGMLSARVIELGCYDAKTVYFLERGSISLERYVGLDANWEGGMDTGREMWKSHQNVEFAFCDKPADMDPYVGEDFNIGVCMETLEHVDADDVEPYLQELSRIVRGYVFITVPIERGLVFFLKHSIKKLLRMSDYPFTPAEFFYSVIGRLNKVNRKEHKGFDDRQFVKQVAKYFDVVSVTGICPGLYPVFLNFGVGVIARTRSS